MNPQPGNGWPPPSGSGASSTNNENHLPGQQRSLGSFGASHSMQPGSSPQMPGPLPQSGPFYSGQANGHPVGNPSSLSHGSPLQMPQGQPAFQQQHSPPSLQHQMPVPGYSLPALNSALQQQQPAPTIQDIEREHMREREMELERRQQQEQMAQREYEREIEAREQQQEQHHPPLENHIGSIPIQQPVASRIPATLHGPNGILNHQHVGSNMAPNPPSAPLGAPSGPGNVFANGMQPAREPSPRTSFIQQGQQMIPTQQLLNPVGADAMQQLPAALSQGAQQPILNDALSYLDQVKVRFVDHPDVYNRFLDIMKDFKSQAIDTPGVIDRVSNLFAGHPELIQGFNTFLPPGYRIECGTQDDPNAIRVTTPMGTTVSQMPAGPNRFMSIMGSAQGPENGISVIRQGPYSDAHSSGEWGPQQQDHSEMGSENQFQPNGRMAGLQYGEPSINGQENGMAYDREDQVTAAEAAHRQEQRGVSNLSHVASAIATNGGSNQLPMAHASPSGGSASNIGPGMAGLNNAGSVLAGGNQLGIEKRGPVEFNHAIGYVNKIKNRFSSQPEIYKSFLEILQTYQRESKPIQDVYAQVTQLFSTAPDLLEDFKQFLPESAAQAKAQQQAAARQATEEAAMLSNVRGDAGYLAGMSSNQTHTPKPEMKMPPVGNFAPPPSAGKESKKRRAPQMTGGAAAPDPVSGSSGPNNRSGAVRGAPANKRARVEQPKTQGPELPPVSPTLVPSLPRPMPPSNTCANTAEELAFFDRVKKHVANKQTYNEFLKVANLFTQEMIDKNTLMHKAYNFIGNNVELMNWFKDFLSYDGSDEIIDNKPKTASSKVMLSNCRGLGPSYRLVPIAAKQDMVCTGRDETCRKVLNDDWSSFPTWASEDSGFIAHRKNFHEDSLSRCEEERHDYDINIESCHRTIQLMEPIVNSIKLMSQEEQRAYKLPNGIGGLSETVYQRVIKKIYGREVGAQVILDMFDMPAAVLPLLVWRLNQKVEEWKASLREWDKIWREQTNKQFWKSLDHQSITMKQAHTSRQFQPKTLQTEIQTKYEEQRRERAISSRPVSKYQFEYNFNDVDVIYDVCHLILTYVHASNHNNTIDQARVESFFGTFIPTFFDLDPDTFQRKMSDIYVDTPPNEDAEDEAVVEEATPARGRRGANGRKGTLLRGVLDRKQRDRDGSALRGSKETTPDVGSMDDENATPSEDMPRVDASDHRWTELPRGPIKGDEPYKRDSFNLYASLHIYCFFRLFEMTYSRFAFIKANEAMVHEDVRRANIHKPADDLGIADKKPAEYFNDIGPGANYYRQVLGQCESILKGELEMSHLEDTLRRFYIQKGYQLYSLEKMLNTCARFAMAILVSDNKDKSLEIIHLFYKDRKEDETTHDAELVYRKQVDKLSKDGDIYRITFNRINRTASVQIFTKETRTFEADTMEAADRYRYYVSAYTMRSETEGVPYARMRYPLLHRNMPPMLDSVEEYNRAYVPHSNKDELMLKFVPKTYKIDYQAGSEEWFVHSKAVWATGTGAMEEKKQERRTGWEGKFGGTEGSLALGIWGKEGVEEMERGWAEFVKDKDAGESVEEEAQEQAKATGEKMEEGTKEQEQAPEGEKGDETMGGV